MSPEGDRQPTAAAWQATWFRCSLIVLIWAGIYLPALGSLQLDHEEPRRALPAVHMLSRGDWLVPRVGSEPYLRKPPLLNWLIAVSFAAFGQTEAAARLPSVLAMLALALTAVIVAGRTWLVNCTHGVLTALFLLTNLAAMEFGRQAELEALYTALVGMALISWLTAWYRAQNPWIPWLAATPFLAFGMLTKGPTELVFFYGTVIPVLVTARERRVLLHRGHWLMLATVLGTFLGWAVPCSFAINPVHPGEVWQVWVDQIGSRASTQPDEHFHLQNYLLSIPLSLKNFLPWTVLLPLLWLVPLTANGPLAPRRERLFRGLRWGFVAVFLAMSLLPNGSPRYLYPLLIVPCLLLEQTLAAGLPRQTVDRVVGAWAASNNVFMALAVLGLICALFLGSHPRMDLRIIILAGSLASVGGLLSRNRKAHRDAPVGVVWEASLSALVMGIITCAFALAVVPRINRDRKHGPREVAAPFRQVVPSGAPIWVDETTYRPFWYYLEPGVRYFHGPENLPNSARFVLTPAHDVGRLTADPRWHKAATLVISPDGSNRPFSLLDLHPDLGETGPLPKQ